MHNANHAELIFQQYATATNIIQNDIIHEYTLKERQVRKLEICIESSQLKLI